MDNSQRTEFLEREVETYRSDDNLSHSPVWIWFSKVNQAELQCLICNKHLPQGKGGTTGGMLHHLKRRHGPLTNYDAFSMFEELGELRDLRIMAKRQGAAAGNTRKRPSNASFNRGGRRTVAVPDIPDMSMEAQGGMTTGALLAEPEDVDDASNHHDQPVCSVKREPPSPRFSALPSSVNAPVYLDVGGTHYTASLESLTRFPTSRLGRMFDGSNTISQDSQTGRYFVDGDGKLFRHILNFCRTKQLTLPDNFDELDLLHQGEAAMEIHDNHTLN